MENTFLIELESCQSQIYNAICTEGRVEKENALAYVISCIPGMKDELKGCWEAWKRQVIGRWYYKCEIHELEDESLEMNLRFCVDIINGKLNRIYTQPISCNAMQLLFFSPKPLPKDKVVHIKENEKLTVSGFLSTLSYAKKIIETYSGVCDSKTDESLLAIKTVELAINHKKEDNPLNKSLHIVNEVLTGCARRSTKDDNNKRIISFGSLMLDLAIDFLIKK